MQVNITLLIQGCNFFVAWFLLHKLLFKPAIAVLDADQRKNEMLTAEQARQELVVQEKKQINQHVWRKLKQFSRQYMPHESSPAIESMNRANESLLVSQERELVHPDQVQSVKEAIIKQVLHVDL
jgi:hypothetical protein